MSRQWFSRWSSVLLLGAILLGLLSSPSVKAQDGTANGPIFLMTGVDVNGEGFPLVIINVGTGETRTLATFGRRALCVPTVMPQATSVLYEVSNPAATTTVFQVDTASGRRDTLRESNDYQLDCPVVSPDGQAIAWIHPVTSENDLMALVLTNNQGLNNRTLIEHPAIHDVTWSPTSTILVYTVTSDTLPMPTLMSLPSQGIAEPYAFWPQKDGYVMDYEWALEGNGLVVAYLTDQFAGVALVPVQCVLGVSDDCAITPIATFPADAKIDLLNAYSPISDETVISVQFPDPTIGFPKADLWVVDLNGQAEPRQVTFSPTLLKTDAAWAPSGREIYFIGSYFDNERNALRGSIYSVPTSGEQEFTLRFESEFFSPATILWQYAPTAN